MWGTVIRFGLRYAFVRRYGNYIIVGVALLFCVLGAILLDAKMYLSAGLTGLIGLAVLIWLPMGSIHARRDTRERQRKKQAEEARRAAAAQARAQARGEKVDWAKTAMADAARTAATHAAGAADLAKTGIGQARDRLGSWRRNEPKE